MHRVLFIRAYQLDWRSNSTPVQMSFSLGMPDIVIPKFVNRTKSLKAFLPINHTKAMKLYFQMLSFYMLGMICFTALVARNDAPDWPIKAERVTFVGNMQATRAAHTSTLLPGGQVLIAGGCTARGCNAGDLAQSAELYNPVTGVFTLTGSMSGDRASEHTATLLQNGQVLITGGWRNQQPTRSTEVFDETSGAFIETGNMLVARAAHTATLLQDGRVLLVGGYDGNQAIKSVEIYNPKTGLFEHTGSLNDARSGHVAILLNNGRVLVVGGGDPYDDIILASAEIYDPVSGQFEKTGNLSKVRHKHAAALLPNGKVLIISGSDVNDFGGRYNHTEMFNPATGTFEPSAQLQSPRFKLPNAVVVLANGEILVAGGDEFAEIYNPTSASFRQVKGSMEELHSFSAATLLLDSSALITGGYTEKIQLTNQAWIYQPE